MKRELEKALQSASLVTSKNYRNDLKQLLTASKRKFLVERDSANRLPGRFLARMLAGADDILSVVKEYVNSRKDVPNQLAARWLEFAAEPKKRGRQARFEKALEQRIDDYCCFLAMSVLIEAGMKQKPAARQVAEMMDRPEKLTRTAEAVLGACKRERTRRRTGPWK